MKNMKKHCTNNHKRPPVYSMTTLTSKQNILGLREGRSGFTILLISVNNHEHATSICFGFTNQFQQGAKLKNQSLQRTRPCCYPSRTQGYPLLFLTKSHGSRDATWSSLSAWRDGRIGGELVSASLFQGTHSFLFSKALSPNFPGILTLPCFSPYAFCISLYRHNHPITRDLFAYLLVSLN